MIYELLDWEMVEVDQGYVGQLNKSHVKYELGVSENQFEAKARARARGEMINGRFKNFCILTDELGVSENQFEAKARARARGEMINGRFKNFRILTDRYRHKISMHTYVIHAVAVLMQISLTTVSPTFKVDYPAHNNFY